MTYADLQTEIADHLWRSDLTDAIPTFVRDAEARLNRDPRVRKHSCSGTYVIVGDGTPVPPDYRALDSWYHDGPTFKGPIEVVDGNRLALVKRRHMNPGVPRYAAIMGRRFYFSPLPDATYETRMSYWRRIPPLSDGNPTNWFLDENPDLYRIAALVEAATYLRDEERLAYFEGRLDAGLEDWWRATGEEYLSGSLVRTFNPIG